MASVALEGKVSTGHGCFPPTNAVGPYSTRTKVNGQFVQLKNTTKYAPHTCGKTTHPTDARIVVGGSSKVRIEGKWCARIGDDIACGDAVSVGSPNTFAG